MDLRSETEMATLINSPLFLFLDVVAELFEVHEFGGKVFASVSLLVALPFLGHGGIGPVRLGEKASHLQLCEGNKCLIFEFGLRI